MSALAVNIDNSISVWEQMLGYEYPRARLSPKSTGLPVTIEVIDNLYNDIPCDPCLVAYRDVDNYDEKCIISLDNNPKSLLSELNDSDFNKIKRFILLNLQLLIDYWNVKLDSVDFYNKVIFCN